MFRSFFSSNLFLRSIRLRSQSRTSNRAFSKSHKAAHFFVAVEMGKPRKSTRAKRKIPTFEELMARKPTPKKQKLEGSEASGEEEEQPKLGEELKAKAITYTPYPTVGYNPVPGGPIVSLKDKLNVSQLSGPSQPGAKRKKAGQAQPDHSTGPHTWTSINPLHYPEVRSNQDGGTAGLNLWSTPRNSRLVGTRMSLILIPSKFF